jgi:transketolase
MADILSTIEQAQAYEGGPVAIIQHTVKGKGVSFMEDNYLWHARVPTAEELESAMAELGEGGAA